MLDSLACHSVEKLVIDAEAIASAQRLVRGIESRTEKLAVAMFAQTGLRGDFLKLKETRALFRSEQHLPSSVVDRGGAASPGEPALDTFGRARERVRELLASYQRPAISPEIEESLRTLAAREAGRVGMKSLPGICMPSAVS
jgi:trimethylamine--corrinoid protein Co-methyltransferase